ncbi:MAG: hypothetical protein AAF634_11990 [Bacteroidota bacterium]
MKKRNKTWFWNVLIGLTLLCCGVAFGLHYKNWVAIEKDHFSITSGIYRQIIPLSAINTLQFVPRIPELERKNGFSWMAKEKGVFMDSITGSKVYVFVDDLWQQKVEMVHHDSLVLYFNMTDSLKTKEFFDTLALKIETGD